MKLASIHSKGFMLWLVMAVFGPGALQAQTMYLQQCIDTALYYNRNIQISRNNLTLSRLRKQEAKSNLSPKVSVSADYKYFTHLPYQLMPLSTFNPAAPEGQYKEAQFGVPHNLGASAQLTMPIYNPQIKTSIQGAEIAAELSDLQLEKNEEQVIFDVTNLYYNAQILQRQILFVDSNLVNIGRLLDAMQLLRTQGLAKGTDVGKIELQQTLLQYQRDQLNGKLAQVLNGLNFYMGRSLETPLYVSVELESRHVTEYPAAISTEVRLSHLKSRLLSNELTLLNKTNLPTISAVANYGLTGFGFHEQPDPFFKIFAVGFVGVQASYPIWNKTTRTKITQKEVEISGNNMQTEQIMAQNDLQIANAVIQRNTAKANIPVMQQQIALANSVYQQTLEQQRQGAATIADVLLADNALRETQTQYINALVEYMKADLELKKASGSIKK